MKINKFTAFWFTNIFVGLLMMVVGNPNDLLGRFGAIWVLISFILAVYNFFKDN